jgi:hypothetical protein
MYITNKIKGRDESLKRILTAGRSLEPSMEALHPDYFRPHAIVNFVSSKGCVEQPFSYAVKLTKTIENLGTIRLSKSYLWHGTKHALDADQKLSESSSNSVRPESDTARADPNHITAGQADLGTPNRQACPDDDSGEQNKAVSPPRPAVTGDSEHAEKSKLGPGLGGTRGTRPETVTVQSNRRAAGSEPRRPGHWPRQLSRAPAGLGLRVGLRNGPQAGRSGQRPEPAVARLDLLRNEFTRGSRAFHLS